MRTLSELDPTLIADASQRIETAQRLVVLTGAGISTDSGIADYRGPNGVWTKDPAAEKASHITTYLADADHRRRRWQRLVETAAIDTRRPNAGHLALASSRIEQRLTLLITQNVDGLHRDAGTDPDRLVEIHGTVRQYKCLSCDERGPIENVVARVQHGDTDPHCSCGGLLKSATVSFGESLNRADLVRSQTAASEADVVLCVGTTLTVNPIAQVAPLGVANGADLIIVNGEPTAFDEIATVVLPASISEVLPVICGVTGTLSS